MNGPILRDAAFGGPQEGAKVLFGGEPATGLAEVGIAKDIATATSAKFKAALGSLAELVAALEESVGKMANRPGKSKWSSAPR